MNPTLTQTRSEWQSAAPPCDGCGPFRRETLRAGLLLCDQCAAKQAVLDAVRDRQVKALRLRRLGVA